MIGNKITIMSKNVFLDLNILFDLLDSNRINSEQSISLINKLNLDYKVNFFTTDSFVYTASFVLRKLNDKNKIIDLISRVIFELNLNFICFEKEELVLKNETNLKDVEDIFMLNSAMKKCDIYFTNDKEVLKNRNDFENNILIFSPTEFL